MGRWVRKRIAPILPILPILFHPAYGLWRLVFFLIKAPPNGICFICAIRGRINTFSLFFSALCAYLSPTDPADFHRFFAYQEYVTLCSSLPYEAG